MGAQDFQFAFTVWHYTSGSETVMSMCALADSIQGLDMLTKHDWLVCRLWQVPTDEEYGCAQYWNTYFTKRLGTQVSLWVAQGTQ